MRRLAMVMPVVFALSASPALGANTTTVDVGLNGSTFTQPDVTIAAGDKIHWVWDAGGHTVTSGAHPPSANALFDTDVQPKDNTFEQTFAHPGLYHYFCKIHYGSGMVGTITVTGSSADPPPNPAFAAPASAQAGQPVQFDASASSASSDGDPIDSYTWEFGDGTQEVTFSPTVLHTFATAGSPTVTLTIDDAGSASGGLSHPIAVQPPPPPNRAPTASFLLALHAQTASFDASASTDPDGDAITAYEWDFGDGTQQTTAGPALSHRYARPGPVTASLVVIDTHDLASARVTRTLTVAPVTPPAPTLTNLRLGATSFCVHKTRRCRHPGTRITFTLSAGVRVSLAVTHGRHRMLRATLNAKAGRNSFPFAGTGLKPGSYVLALTPAGGRAVKTAFSVIAR